MVSRKKCSCSLCSYLSTKSLCVGLGPFKSIIQTSIILCHSFDTISHILLIGDYLPCLENPYINVKQMFMLPISLWPSCSYIYFGRGSSLTLNIKVRVVHLSHESVINQSVNGQRTHFMRNANPEGLTLNEKGLQTASHLLFPFPLLKAQAM